MKTFLAYALCFLLVLPRVSFVVEQNEQRAFAIQVVSYFTSSKDNFHEFMGSSPALNSQDQKDLNQVFKSIADWPKVEVSDESITMRLGKRDLRIRITNLLNSEYEFNGKAYKFSEYTSIRSHAKNIAKLLGSSKTSNYIKFKLFSEAKAQDYDLLNDIANPGNPLSPLHPMWSGGAGGGAAAGVSLATLAWIGAAVGVVVLGYLAYEERSECLETNFKFQLTKSECNFALFAKWIGRDPQKKLRVDYFNCDPKNRKLTLTLSTAKWNSGSATMSVNWDEAKRIQEIDLYRGGDTRKLTVSGDRISNINDSKPIELSDGKKIGGFQNSSADHLSAIVPQAQYFRDVCLDEKRRTEFQRSLDSKVSPAVDSSIGNAVR
jgi:hypothetical protein